MTARSPVKINTVSFKDYMTPTVSVTVIRVVKNRLPLKKSNA